MAKFEVTDKVKSNTKLEVGLFGTVIAAGSVGVVTRVYSWGGNVDVVFQKPNKQATNVPAASFDKLER